MSINISNVVAKKFENEAIQSFQEMGSDLRSNVRVRDAKNAKQVQFHVIGTATANERTSIQTPIPVADVAHTAVTATVKNYVVSEMTDIFLNNQITFDERQELVQALTGSMKRRLDQVVIDAFDAHSFGNTVASGSDNLNVSHFANMAKALGSKVPENDRCVLIHDNGFYHFIQEADVKTIDSNLRKPLTDGKLPEYLGFGIKKIADRAEGGLTLSTNDRTNYFWQKSAVGLALNMEPKIEINYEPSYGAHRVTGMLSAGAVVIQDAGVGKLTTDES